MNGKGKVRNQIALVDIKLRPGDNAVVIRVESDHVEKPRTIVVNYLLRVHLPRQLTNQLD